jgi:hypothetical protein
MVNDIVENQYVIAERPKDTSYTPNGMRHLLQALFSHSSFNGILGTPAPSHVGLHSQSTSRPGTPSSFRSPASTPLPISMLSQSSQPSSSQSSSSSRARSTMLAGAVRHECNVRPILTSAYRRRMKERSIAANTNRRPIRRLDEDTGPTDGVNTVNMLSSGVQDSGAFSGFVVRFHILSVQRPI